jgi:hypothetical protein
MGKSKIKSNGFIFDVCQNLFVNVLNLIDERIVTINETRFDPGPNVHKNTGNTNAYHIKEVHQSDVSFVKDKGDKCGDFYATHLTRHLTRYELRDEEKDAVDLSSNLTYRNLYEQYCYVRGWLAKSTNKGHHPRLEDYKKRKKDDCIFEEEDVVTEEVVSWWSFRQIWKVDLPKIASAHHMMARTDKTRFYAMRVVAARCDKVTMTSVTVATATMMTTRSGRMILKKERRKSFIW